MSKEGVQECQTRPAQPGHEFRTPIVKEVPRGTRNAGGGGHQTASTQPGTAQSDIRTDQAESRPAPQQCQPSRSQLSEEAGLGLVQ